MKQYARILALGLGLGLAGGLGALSQADRALAQAADTPPAHDHHPGGPGREGGHDWSPSKHIEGHLAFLHTELGITQAQEPQWQAVAQVMRAQAKHMDEMMAKYRADHAASGGHDKAHESVIDRLQMQQTMATAHAQAVGELLTALKPLYASLSDTQKKSADELLSHHSHHGQMHGPM